MFLSDKNMALLRAFDDGYRINEDCEIVNPKGKILKGWINRRGYKRFRPYRNTCAVMAHRLAAYQKFGDAIFESGIVVRHLDDNKSNICPDNLELGTQADNMQDKVRNYYARKK